jgi:hypothetical protein
MIQNRQIISRLPFLGLCLGLLLLFFPENNHGSSHSHLSHLLGVSASLFIFFLAVLKQKGFLQSSSKFQSATLIILSSFIFLYVTPSFSSFKHHHTSQAGQEHPCCVTQAVSLVEVVTPTIISKSFNHHDQSFPPLSPQSLDRRINNKSPPQTIS